MRASPSSIDYVAVGYCKPAATSKHIPAQMLSDWLSLEVSRRLFWYVARRQLGGLLLVGGARFYFIPAKQVQTITRVVHDYMARAMGFQTQVYEIVDDVCEKGSVISVPGEPDAGDGGEHVVEASACAA